MKAHVGRDTEGPAAVSGYPAPFYFLSLNRPETFLRGRLPRLESLLQVIESFLFLLEQILGAQLKTGGGFRLLGIQFLLSGMY